MIESELFARLFGYFSIGCWIVVFTPQFYENYKLKNTDGVSVTFLTLWILGDILNLFGIILQNLLFTMLLLALYYLMADCMLMAQVFYYRRPHQPIEEEVHVYETGPDETTRLLNHDAATVSRAKNPKTRGIIRLFFVSSVCLWLGLLGGSALFFLWPGQTTDWSQWQIVPQMFGWGSAILYCSSRIPQIMQNFRNESVQGLSLVMFIFSVVGNITYCVSIVLESTDPTYLLINYPWILGSGGTLFFDFTIFFQFYMYRKRTDVEFKNINEDD
ncbi:PQ loop repeat-domain-containing protein [Mucor mucedo]|uniref:PQ loop repeat-domain-containing protein n=1 Tax=Mucor mucedo TaxID=29922 RepID=UPI00221F8604|nr:PQ loop repeat-domain-containing protein [Mucor mucedo]KAI7892995.1 PQ loop repeat-domain-containing protein [Mucor mucedo]